MFRYLRSKLYQRRYLKSWTGGVCFLGYPPSELFIEPTNNCNLRCLMCPQSKGLKRPKGYMDMELYKKIIKDIRGLELRRVNLFMGGESFLHPRIPEMIKIAKKAGLNVRLHTNGTLLDKKLNKEIIFSGLDSISFSFDGETKEKYEEMRQKADYNDVLERIRSFLKEKLTLSRKAPYVQVQVIKDYDSRQEKPVVSEDFKRLFSGLPVDRFNAIWFLSFGGHLVDSGFKYPEGKFYQPCRQLWSRFAIGWDGKAFACCIDSNGELQVGDAVSQSLMDIWNGEAMQRMRRLMAEKKLGELPSLCKSCNLIWSDSDYLELKSKKGRKDAKTEKSG
ncbi:MAG: radical SAM/SPASM domain-containing protein [Candidatus Omnitrophota bacterium]